MSDYVDDRDILTREEVELKRKEIMRDHLTDIFDRDSILYQIYKSRNWEDKLFTDPILLMDTKAQYNTSQVATICEVPVHLINNRRRDLIDYLQPEVYGEDNNKVFKHNYISVFKMKMVIGLTGEGGEYTVPNLKELLYNGAKLGNKANPNSNNNNFVNGDAYQIMNFMKRFEKFQELIESEEFFKEIDKRVAITTEKLLSTSKDDSGVNESKKLYDYICGNSGSLIDKEESLKDFDHLVSTYPGQAHMIYMYKTAAEERISRIKQDERELEIKKIKLKIADLIDSYSNAHSENERESIKSQISRISEENSELNFEIRMWLATNSKQPIKKGFLSRLFSK